MNDMGTATDIAPASAQGRAASAGRRRRLSVETELRRARILLDVAERCSALNDLDEVLGELVTLTSRALECDRGTLFLNDPTTGELYSRVAQGNLRREIRILNTSGIAGAVFQAGEGLVIDDPYADPRFNASVDERTGYTTRSIVCAPVRTVAGEIIGVMQSLNKLSGPFGQDDLELLEAMTRQAAIVLQSLQTVERIGKMRAKEMAFLDLVSDINSEFDLSRLLARAVTEITTMLDADRATVFVHDPATDTLFSRVAAGPEVNEIRLPSWAGIAGTVFTKGASLNIPHAYADLRFNPSFDRQTGYFTRSILCVPLANKEGKLIGVTQVLNKKGGAFSDEDEQRLKAFTAQISIALENSKLFDDVQRVRAYNESMLQSMSNGVVTMDAGHKIVTCNMAAAKIWEADLVGKALADLLDEEGGWILDRIAAVKQTAVAETFNDASVTIGGHTRSVNLTVMPLVAAEGDKELGSMLMFEDISSEKRMKSTMSRYMDPQIAAQMLDGNSQDMLGGVATEATIMFTDVRGFTTITEEYGAQGTVSFLNEYFTKMVDCISREGGMLDKFIGDAIMACFGLPLAHDDDPDRAVRTGIAMIRELWEWNTERRAMGLKTVDMGVGLNTDMIVSGNIGSPKRMDYTVIGDGVNLASRLESACKAYSARILVGESTVNKLKGTYRMRDIDLVVVKGKTEPIRVFEVLDYHTAETFPNMLDVVEYFNDGIRAYRGAEWDKARSRFEKCLELNPGDGLSRTYVGRCDLLQADPPEGQWDGVWVMKEK